MSVSKEDAREIRYWYESATLEHRLREEKKIKDLLDKYGFEFLGDAYQAVTGWGIPAPNKKKEISE